MTKAKKSATQAEAPAKREKKKIFVVQVACKDANNAIVKHVSYPETTTNEKALHLAIKEFQNVIGVQITGFYSSTQELIKALQKQAEK